MRAYVYNEIEVYKAMGETAYIDLLHTKLPLPSTLEQTEQMWSNWLFFPRDIGPWENKYGLQEVREGLKRLPYWEKEEGNHILFMHSDNADPLGTSAVIFRQSCNRLRKDVNTISFPTRAENFTEIAAIPLADLPYNVCFVGHVTATDYRFTACSHLAQRKDALIDGYHKHWGAYENTELGKQRRNKFVSGLMLSKMCFAPRGGGEHSFRFFEAMSAGRIPILMADTYEPPFEDLIDYEKCSFTVPESDADVIGNVIDAILRTFSDDELQEMADKAREYWLAYLREDVWFAMIDMCLEKIMYERRGGNGK